MRKIVGPVLAFVLAGCYEINQSLVIDDRNFVSYQGDVHLNSTLVKVVEYGTDGDAPPEEEICREIDDFSSNIPGQFKEKLRPHYQEKDLICEYTLSGTLQYFEELDLKTKPKSSSQSDMFAMEFLPGRQIRITSVFDMREEYQDGGPDLSGEGDFIEGMMRGMFESLFEGRFLRWQVTAPEIVYSNGTVSADRKTVNWELPIDTAMKEQKIYRFETIVKYRKPLAGRVKNSL